MKFEDRYAQYHEWGSKPAEGQTTAELKPFAAGYFLQRMLGSRAGERTWPRWWCWLMGHVPTECDDFARDTNRCRCGTVRDFPGARVADIWPAWWLRLCGGMRWRHLWVGIVPSSQRPLQHPPSTSRHGDDG